MNEFNPRVTLIARLRLYADQAEIADEAMSEFSHDMNEAADLLEEEAAPPTDEWEYGVAWEYRDSLAGYVVKNADAARQLVEKGKTDTDYDFMDFVARRRPARPAGPWEVVPDGE